jgi:predicted Co/Zn/Cd cation transporter (cation efflux family)
MADGLDPNARRALHIVATVVIAGVGAAQILLDAGYGPMLGRAVTYVLVAALVAACVYAGVPRLGRRFKTAFVVLLVAAASVWLLAASPLTRFVGFTAVVGVNLAGMAIARRRLDHELEEIDLHL